MSFSGFEENRKTESRMYRKENDTGIGYFKNGYNNFLQTHYTSSLLDISLNALVVYNRKIDKCLD